MTVYVRDADFTLHVGDVREVLAGLPDESVDCVITSPPYWGLRDYGTGTWAGGDPDCDHQKPKQKERTFYSGSGADGKNCMSWTERDGKTYLDKCGKCGATRQDHQLGLEPTPDEYVANMVAVFREVRRVLAPHGTCWVNLGDSYASGVVPPGFRPKDLVGVPWRVAFALQTDGWYLRSDIVWSKCNPMPESVTDRPTKSHEYVFLLTKQPRYWFDSEAVREPHKVAHIQRQDSAPKDRGDQRQFRKQGLHDFVNPAGRNIRSVWEIATQPYPEAHFATYPEELVRRCLLAGCPEWVCRTCGKPRERIVEREVNATGSGRANISGGSGFNGWEGVPRASLNVHTLGWSDCGHNNYRPGVVLDPFLGSGTTALVARRHGRHTVGIELNETYAELAARRLQQLSLLAECKP